MIDDGGPAFPQAIQEPGNVRFLISGMTLRDYFAGQALPSCIGQCHDDWEITAAKAAYKLADAMLSERAQRS